MIGEGGSGGSLALGVADRLLMLEHSVFSVATPRGGPSFDRVEGQQARPLGGRSAQADRPRSARLGVADRIVPEPAGGAHSDQAATAEALRGGPAAREGRRNCGRCPSSGCWPTGTRSTGESAPSTASSARRRVAARAGRRARRQLAVLREQGERPVERVDRLGDVPRVVHGGEIICRRRSPRRRAASPSAAGGRTPGPSPPGVFRVSASRETSPPAVPSTPRRCMTSFMPSRMASAVAVAFRCTAGSLTISRQATPAAGEGVGVEGAGVGDAPVRVPPGSSSRTSKQVEDVRAAGRRRRPGSPPARIFARVVRSGVTPKCFLGAAGGVAEAGDDLVEDQDDAVLGGSAISRRTACRGIGPQEAPLGIEDHGGDVAASSISASIGGDVAAQARAWWPARRRDAPGEGDVVRRLMATVA